MTNYNPERVCEVLVAEGRLDTEPDSITLFGLYDNSGCFVSFETAKDAISDPRVAEAAWGAVKAKYGDNVYMVRDHLAADRTRIVRFVLDQSTNGASEIRFAAKGTDTAAMTTVCAMALAGEK